MGHIAFGAHFNFILPPDLLCEKEIKERERDNERAKKTNGKNIIARA